MMLLLAAIVASPAVALVVHRLAKELGFLDPPASKEQEHKRAVLVAIYALLVFLPVFLFGWERRWPRVWAAFGVVSGAALVFFAGSGLVATARLWRLRHPLPPADAPAETIAHPSEPGAAREGNPL
ncbi:MAG TPA: hypothetical protein VIA45_08205 [Thermoanaerobaculia bacterium]